MIVLVGLAAAVVTVSGIRAMAWLIGPAFLALIIVIAVSPVQGWLLKKPGAGWADALLRDRPVAPQAATDAAPPGRTDGAIRQSPSPGQGEVPVH